MGKAPAFQFYPKDFLSDVELQAASASTRGVWINGLCLMWVARERGILTGRRESLARLLNCTLPEFDLFIEEASVTKFADVTTCNDEVTIKNRRMWNDEKVRHQTRLRVRKHRDNVKESAQCNAEVTPPSSSSTPSPKKNKGKSPGGDDSFGEDFESFWKAYHPDGKRGASKAKASAAFKAALKKADGQTILAGLERANAYWRARGTIPGAFIPNPCQPATWLNQERWAADYSLPAPSSQPGAAPAPAGSKIWSVRL